MRKFRITFLTLLTVLVLLFAGMTANAEDVNKESEQKATRLYEVEDKRTLSSRAFAMSDGTVQHELFASNIHYKDNNGQLKKIDIKVKDIDSTKNQGYKYKNTENDWDVFFADKGKAQDMVKITKGKYHISFSMNE